MKSEARTDVLAAAIMLFARDGYAETTVSAIAARAGTTSSFIYRTFGGKRNLYQEALHTAVVNVRTPGRSSSLLQPSAFLVVQIFNPIETWD